MAGLLYDLSYEIVEAASAGQTTDNNEVKL